MGSANTLFHCLERWLQRQSTPQWGQFYQPAIQATVREAPKSSNAFLVAWHKMRRDLHALSTTEFFALLLALFWPGLLDLLEQRALWPWTTPHPLDGSPYADGAISLPPMPGLLAIAKKMGQVDQLVKVSSPGSRTKSGKKATAPMPMLGDLLLILADKNGPYCVNWTIKLDRRSFNEPAFGSIRYKRSAAGIYKESFRHTVERENYAAANIRTVQICADDFNAEVFSNLAMLYSAGEPEPVQTAALNDLEGRLVYGLEAGIPPLASFEAVMHRYRCELEYCTAIARRMIWSRRLLVDLYSAVLWDRPLKPMGRDVLVQYASWFGR